ncbi:hypothetical protein FACS18949_08190 [Clostridia bacterium]|nr:hypothetical protein FACS18949_08190 [Clostridia bacterium]
MKTNKREYADALDNLQELSEQLHDARLRFNQATEPELVDACVFELNALQARYNFFLRMARELEGVTAAERTGVPV